MGWFRFTPVLILAVGCGTMTPMPDAGTSGGGSAGGTAGGGTAGGASAGGTAGGASAGGGTAGGASAGGTAGGASAGGTAGGASAGGTAGGASAGGTAGGVALPDPCGPMSFDAGVPGGELLPDGGFSPPGAQVLPDAGLTASATSFFGSGYPPQNAIDLDVQTSWYLASDVCVASSMSALNCCSTSHIAVRLPSPRAVSAVVLRGNRDFEDNYDFLTGRLELLDDSGAVLVARLVVFSRPESDWAGTFAPPVSNVRTVRLVPGWSQNEGGLAEVGVYSP